MPQSFVVLAENKVVGVPDGNILSWCPQMDLLALSMNQTSIWMFRLDGERIYSINNRSKILQLRWSDSGKFFVVSGIDKMIKVYDSNTGKLVNNFSTNTEMDITLVSWEAIDIERSMNQGQDTSPFRDLFKVEILDNMPKLANEISSVEVSEVPDPANAPEKSVSVTNTNKDTLSMDYLFVVNANSCVSFTFDNLFTVSNIELQNDLTVLHHLMAQDLFSQFLLVKDTNSDLYLQELTIGVTSSSSRANVFEVIGWASKLISIVNHIGEQIESVKTEAKGFLTLFDRHLSNYKDALYEDVDLATDFPTPEMVEEAILDDMTSMLLTGLIKARMKDYWLNQFGEKNLLRLSAIGNACYDNLRKVVFTQIVLASEKIIILLSFLEGSATTELYFRRETYGIEISQIAKAVENAQNVVKDLFAFIWELNKEHNSFNVFLNWARIEVIKKLHYEDNDPEDFFKENPNLSFQSTEVMEYIDKFLLDSVLWNLLDAESCNTEVFRKQCTRKLDVIPNIEALQKVIKTVTDGIEQYLAKKVSFRRPEPLGVQCGDSNTDIALLSTGILIAAVDSASLTMVQYQSGGQKRTNIKFFSHIIAHKIISSENVLVLHESGENVFSLDLIRFDLTKDSDSIREECVLKSLIFTAETFVKHPKYMAINRIGSDLRTIGLVMDESKKQYVVFEI